MPTEPSNSNHNDNLPFTSWLKKTRLLCLRGNLETELVLQPFLNNLDPDITKDKQQLIELFLNESEQNLFHWLIGESSAKQNQQAVKTQPPAQYLALIADIKASYQVGLAKPHNK